MTASAPALQSAEVLLNFCHAARDDLHLLSQLHDQELTREMLDALSEAPIAELFGLRLGGTEARTALTLLQDGLGDLPPERPDEAMDILASEYADIYLNYGLNVSPCESVWIDEDGLTMQEAMFQIRGHYARHGLEVENWRMRSDDHLVLQLRFLAHLFNEATSREQLREIADFLDEHLLRWIGDFAERVAARCRTRLYAGVASLTSAYLEELRDLLAKLLGQPRPSAEEIQQRMRAKQAPSGVSVAAPAPFAPGAEPGW